MSLSEFLYMGGYAFYVWSSYAVVTAVLVGNIVAARMRRRRAVESIRRRIDEEEEGDQT